MKPIDPELDPRCLDIEAYPGHIVFVHVGPNRPRLCLSDAADQAFEEDPDALVWIFTERDYGPRIQGRMKHGSAPRVRFVFTDEVPVLSLHEEFREKRKFPPGGGDFWRVTSERFYYLYDLLRHLGLKVVVHVESDVMIYAPLTSLINDRRKNATVLFPLDKSRGIASVIFFEDQNACAQLCRHGIDYPAAHDMDLLEKYFQAFKTSDCASLPTIPKSLCEAHGWDSERYARPKDEGWGIFDAAALGQFLGGIDPIHERRDTRGFENEESPFKPSLLELSWAYRERKKTPVSLTLEELPVRNLHIHSKRTRLFCSNVDIPVDPDEIITGERVMTLCDIVVTTQAKMAYHKICTPGMPTFTNLNDFHFAGTTKIRQELFEILDDHRVIFVYGDMFRFFANHIAPHLEEEHVIVVHNSDQEIDDSFNDIFTNPLIKKVFAQNLTSLHPKMCGIPIGLANPMFPHGNITAFAEACRTMKKRPAIFCEGIGNTHSSRASLFTTNLKVLGGTLARRRGYPEYLSRLVNSSHALCPRGNGIDTHRLWESIYSGTVPVITKEEMHRALDSTQAVTLRVWAEVINLTNLTAHHQNHNIYTVENTLSHLKHKILAR